MLIGRRISLSRLLGILLLYSLSQKSVLSNEELTTEFLFNDGWLFKRGESEYAQFPETPDQTWGKVTLPHDWAIKESFDPKRDARTGSLPIDEISWYRKHFFMPEAHRGKQVSIRFDGAMLHSHVWINGHYLGERPNGYISFEYDITRYLQFGKEHHNVLSVKLTPLKNASRWYPGAGIYRNVWLNVRDPIHVTSDGIYITTPKISDEKGHVRIQTEVANHTERQLTINVEHQIFDPTGKLIASSSKKLLAPESDSRKTADKLVIEEPILWDTENPALYKAITTLFKSGKAIDRQETTFGIRSIDFSAENGFLLNGKRTRLKGVCLHHDLGPLGAAVNRAAIERRLRILKEMGANAIRTSHNPPSPDFLNLCDQYGFLVQVEAFDAWQMAKVENGYAKHFQDWHEKDLRSLIRRDRNHPSIIMWSIGNEILEQNEPEIGIEIARRLNEICHLEDPTRPTTACFNYYPAPIANGLAAEVDIVGLNYHPASYGDLLEQHPDWIVYGSETASTVSSRGVYHFPVEKYESHESHQITSYDLVGPAWAYPPDIEFHYQEKHPQLLGEFIWTGFDYLGEPTPFDWDEYTSNGQNAAWPSRSSYFGAVDLCGFPKDRFYLYQSQWSEKPMVHMLPHWNWPGKENQIIPVNAYSNCDEVELIVNGRSFGKKRPGIDTTKIPVDFYNFDNEFFDSKYRIQWEVPYQAGYIKTIGYVNGKPVCEKESRTASEPAKLILESNRSSISPDGYDLSFITVKVLDENGNLCPLADNLIQFKVDGPGEIAAVGNGNPASNEAFFADERCAFNGLCLVVVRSLPGQTGSIRLRATSDNLSSSDIRIDSIYNQTTPTFATSNVLF